MSDPTQGPPPEPDPGEVEPTDNSSGTPVDVERVEELESETAEGR